MGSVGTVLGGFRSPGGRIRGFPGRRGRGGFQQLAGVEDIAGAVTIASVGINI